MIKVEYVVIFLAIGYLEALKLPNYIAPCSSSDPNLNECARKHGEEALQYIVKGDNKYKIPRMIPLNVPEIKFSSGGLNIDLLNVKISGLENSRIKDMQVDIPNKHLSVTLLIDTASLASDYIISGNILILQINGEGLANITFDGGEYTYKFDYTLVDKHGEQYMEIQNDKLTYKTNRSYYYFENLFGGDKALGKQMNEFLNENWNEVEHEIGPALTKTISSIVKMTLAGILKKVPYKDILLP